MAINQDLQASQIIDIFKNDLREAERLRDLGNTEESSKLLINASYSLINNLNIDISPPKK